MTSRTGSVEPVLRPLHRLRHRLINSFSPTVRSDQVRFESAVGERRVRSRRLPVRVEVNTNDANVERWESRALVEERSLRVKLRAS